MLVLSRKQNQEIIIGDNIKITVVKMKGNTVRLGIEAPREVNVLRGELPRHENPNNKFANSAEPQGEITVVFSNHDGDKYPLDESRVFRIVKNHQKTDGSGKANDIKGANASVAKTASQLPN